MRGNLVHGHGVAVVRGPIPACAGQPAKNTFKIIILQAYPRVCGATFSKYAVMVPEQGLSPRVRGNRSQ